MSRGKDGKELKKPYSVSLEPRCQKYLIKKYGSLTLALATLLPKEYGGKK